MEGSTRQLETTPIRSPEALGRALRRARRRADLTQEQLAARVLRRRQEIIALESGRETRALQLLFDSIAALGLELRLAERGSRRAT
jgi:HTH-type transcriptional regulator/antitoxin HipB